MIVNVAHDWELHCHSTFSDGLLTLPELFTLATENNIQHLALTDHDTAAGYRAALAENIVPKSLSLYPATELSCVWKGRTIHIVGLGIDAHSDAWLTVEADYVQRREARFERIVTVLTKAGFVLDEQRIRDIAQPGPPARPHIARYLIETEQVKDSAEVYKKWLGQGKIGDVKQQWPQLEEAVRAITDNGGLAVIAHPHRYDLTWTKTREFLDDFCAAGGQAVETSCVGMHPERQKFLVQQAIERGLMVSGGSDFHSPNTPWLKLGTFPSWPNKAMKVTDWLLEKYAGK